MLEEELKDMSEEEKALVKEFIDKKGGRGIKMYENEVDNLLEGKYSKQTLQKVHAQWKKMNGTVTLPHHIFVSTAKIALEEIFLGIVHLKYASEMLMALKYTDNSYHFQTNVSMLDDIVTNQRIYFHYYQ